VPTAPSDAALITFVSGPSDSAGASLIAALAGAVCLALATRQRRRG